MKTRKKKHADHPGGLRQQGVHALNPLDAYRTDAATTRELVKDVADKATALTEAAAKLVHWCEAADRVVG